MDDSQKIILTLQSGNFSEIWLDSPGGDSAAGYKLGKAIREKRHLTRIPQGARCASACVDVFLGGVIRFVDEKASLIIHPGSVSRSDQVNQYVHNALRQGKGSEAIQSVERLNSAETSLWIDYLLFMGVSSEIVAYAAEVPHDCGIVLNRKELVYFNILNTSGQPAPGYKPSDPKIECGFGR